MVSFEQIEYLWKFKEQISKKVTFFQCSRQKKEREFSKSSLDGINLNCRWKLVKLCLEKCVTLSYLTVCSCHVTYAFQSESTLYSCLNVKELLARNRREIWSLSDCNGIRTHNHLICKRTLNHLAKLAKWLSCVVSTYLYGAFDYMFLSCHVRVSEWIHTL